MNKLKIANQIPFKVLVKRIIKKILPKSRISYSASDFREINNKLKIYKLLNSSSLKAEINQERINHYLNHEFDLLGIGWVSRNFGSKNQVHHNHQKTTDEIAGLINADYKKINWQKDVKTGYEYDISKSFCSQNTPSGVDIKDLWELGRLQHLPQLALASQKEEFRNQCLDFIAYNPIGMGVHWACTMDVGIRVCNMLLAYDILNQNFDDEFNKVFVNSIYQHGQFIFNHLEYKEGVSGNHYLFNLVGLLFAGYYLDIGKWKKFAREELLAEVDKQFFNDGGNFEGSTVYHCLSAEAVLYATTLMLSEGELSDKYVIKVERIASFIKAIIKPNGEIPQFGDNDSGRLFKQTNEDDNLLNYQSLISGYSAICDLDSDKSVCKTIIEQLAKGNKLKASDSLIHGFISRNLSLSKRPFENESIIKFGSDIDLNKLEYFAFPEFGLYVYKSFNFYLAISAIANEKMHHSWGHVHNDKLSFELQVNGQDLVKDVGSYLYTSNPKARDEFRSTKAHHSILVKGIEQNKMLAPFYMERECVCSLLSSKPNEIILQAIYYGVVHERRFKIEPDQLIITDYCNKPFEVNINRFESYSPNYGIKQ